MTNDRYLIYDLYRYFYPNNRVNQTGLIKKIKLILMTQGIWALIVFRAGAWCVRRKNKSKNPLFRVISIFLTVCQKLVEIMTGISIPFTAQIGRGLYIGHFGGIIIGTAVKMGNFCNISQGVTIGQAGRDGMQLSPTIGDRVYIGPGAKIFGGIHVGNDAAIGANAVVTTDIPDNAVAVGIPARVINYKSSRDFVLFNQTKIASLTAKRAD